MAKKTLNRPEVQQGIYIDFEGTQKDPPVMLGVHWVTRDGQVLFEENNHRCVMFTSPHFSFR